MAININGYNSTFDAFVKFAESAAAAGKQKAVARYDTANLNELGGIVNRTIKPGSGDWVGIGAGRLASLKKANNITRDAFMKAVADMFGGKDHIPDNVMEAMKLEDYGKGKPLTARRILAVKAAIENSGFLEQKALEVSMEKAALGKGYLKSELLRLAVAANLYAKAEGCSEAEAFEAVTTPGSKQNRLMNYGGRFLKSADNFKNGLRLLDAFSEWYDETNRALYTGGSMKYEEGMSKTVLNARGKGFKDIYKSGTEKFVFEELAFNPALDLAATDVNDVFGMEKNHATSCIGRDFSESFAQTFAQVPPEKRPILFKSLTVFYPLYASNAEQAKVPYENRNVISSGKVGYLTGRILKHLDQIAGLSKDGKLDAAHLVKLCFPEIKSVGANPINDAIDVFNRWDIEMYGDYSDEDNPVDPKYSPNAIVNMQTLMEATGCTLEEADTAYKGGRRPPNVPYYSDGSLELSAFDGTTKTARETLVGDLTRPTDYSYTAEPKKGLLGEKAGFTFNLPDGERLVTNSSEQGKANVNKVVDKLEALCGKSHPRQASSLLMMLSQSGLVALKGGLRGNGIESDEHVSMDFTITRDAETGDISILYTSPRELPFSFSWTATIMPDGYVSTTPRLFRDEATLKAEIDATTEVVSNARGIKRAKPEVKEMVVSTIMESARNDPDLRFLLRMHEGEVAMGVAVNGESQIRSPEKIKKKLDELKANIEELRAVSKGNRRIFEAGLKQIAWLKGTAYAPGVITKMYNLAAEADLDALKIKGLSESTSPEEIYAMACNVDRITRRMFTETNVMASFGGNLGDIDSPGAAERFGSTSMAMSFLFARCDDKTLNGVRAAGNSVNAEKLGTALVDLQEGRFPPGVKPGRGFRHAIMNVAMTVGNSYLSDIMGTVGDVLGIEVSAPGNVADNPALSMRTKASPESALRILELVEEQIQSVDAYMQIANREQAAANSKPSMIKV